MISTILLYLFVITCVFLIYKIEIGFALAVASYVFILPIAKLNIGFVDVTFSNAITLATWGGFIFYKLSNKGKAIPSNNNSIKNFIIVFFILNFFVVLLSSSISILGQLDYIFFAYFIPLSYCYIAWQIYKEKKDINKFVIVISVISLVTTVYGIYCYLTISNPFLLLMELNFESPRTLLSRMEEARGGLQGRVQSVMYHAITWGGVCMILFSFFINNKVQFNKILRVLFLILFFVNVIMCGSRSAILSLLVFLAAFFLFIENKYKKRIVKYVFVSSLLFVLVLPFTNVFEEYEGIIKSTIFFWDESIASEYDVRGSSPSMRMEQLKGTFKMIEDSPIAGLGHRYTGAYQEKYGQHPILLGFESLIFNKLVENGFMGILIWGLFFYSLYKIPNSVTNSSRSTISIIFIKSYVIGYLVFCLLTGFMHTLFMFLIVYTMLLKIVIIDEAQTNNTQLYGNKILES